MAVATGAGAGADVGAAEDVDAEVRKCRGKPGRVRERKDTRRKT